MLKNLVYIAVFTLFVTGIWVGLSIYHNFSSSTISKDLDIQIVSIDDTFDTSAIDILKKKQLLDVSLSQTVSTASGTLARPQSIPVTIITSSTSAKITITPSPTSLPTISPSPSASGSGQTIPVGF